MPQLCHNLCNYSNMSNPLLDQRSRVRPIRRSVRINVVDVASTADLRLPTSTSVSDVPSRRSTRKAKSFTVSEQNTVLPSQGSGSTIDPTKSRQGLTTQKRKQPGKIQVVVDGDDGVEAFLQPVTEEDRRMWKGWCELESEPVCLRFPMMETFPFCCCPILNIASR